MKRRDFLKTASAAAAVPALPLKAIAGSGVSAAVYAKAEHYASLWVYTSANMFKNTFGLEDAAAKSLFNSLVQNGVVANTNAYGVARATLPYFENPAFLAQVAKPFTPNKPALSVQTDRLDQLIEEKVTEAIEESEAEQTDEPS